ncbi:MAG: LysR family transcriptional regulator [Solobacterium sp.]|nr:LysR family transcriptional regulator [Solobacterium sp.]
MLDSKIYTLLKIVETGSYTHAAKEMNLSQPAVSQQVRGLENDLNTRIFERVGNHLILTREGDKVVNCARAMVSLYANLKTELSNEAIGITTMKIGITHTVESNRISEVFARFASSSSGTTIKLFTDTQSKLKEKLRNFELDFAIIDGNVSDPSLKSTQLDMDSLMLVVATGHALAEKSIVTVDDIKKEKLILRLPNSGTRDLFIASLESRGLSIAEFDVILEIDNVATIKDLVRHGYGVSVLAKSACMDELRKKKLVALPIENLSMNREINIVYSEYFKYPEILKEIINIYNEM